MSTAIVPSAALNEEVWLAWVEKNKRREERTASKVKLVGKIVLIAAVFGYAIFRLAQ